MNRYSPSLRFDHEADRSVLPRHMHLALSGMTTAPRLTVERMLSDPQTCTTLVDAFASKVNFLKAEEGVTHLVFIQKRQVRSAGTLLMMSSLISATNMPGYIFQEAGPYGLQDILGMLGRHSRLAIIHDVMFTGRSILAAADAIRDATEASTAAAVVVSAFGSWTTGIHSPKGQTIRLEALDWQTEPATVMSGVESDHHREIPPGSYTRETLPPISDGARRILSEIYKRRETLDGSIPVYPAIAPARGVRIQEAGRAVGVRIEDTGRALGLKG